MSTLSGLAAKGEKGKSKFQSLDINNLYRASRGESLETHQHKNTSSRRHGMQTLGKVPSTRRPPANLPSLKSEYSGNDPAVSLVPSGGTGWGSKPGETGPAPISTQVPTPTTVTVTSTPSTTAPVTVSTPPTTSTTVVTPTTVTSQGHSGDKSWSSITSSGTENTPMFLAHQSPYFQQEFPSLSGDANATGSGPNKSDSSHLPGPSLRPQTEGSWMQGGSRPQGQTAAAVGNQQGTVPVPGPHLSQGIDVGGARSSLAPSGVAVGPAGPMPPHHYRLLPQFMIRHNHPAGGFPPNYQHGPMRPRMPYPPEPRFMPPNRGPSNVDPEEITSRPIIKEEDLKVMDEISRDTGWAAHDEIDYNQTLSFSDEEGTQDDDKSKKSSFADKKDIDKSSEKENEREEKLNRDNSRESLSASQSENREPSRAWQQPRPADFRQGMPPAMMGFPPQPTRVPAHSSGMQGEDEEFFVRERRRLQNEEIAIVKERAKQRKEEEEKRYVESRQAAARKLQILEEKMLRSKSGIEKDENRTSPSLNVQHGSNTLLPDWEKDKDKSRSRTNSEDKDEKPPKEHSENFRNVQVDNRGNFGRDRERERDRDLRPDRDGGSQPFSRQFQSNLPPRFQKHAAERPAPYYRQNSGGSPQPPYDTRWSVGQVSSHFGGPVGNVRSHRNRNDSDVSERDNRDDNKENNRDRDRSGNDGTFDNHDKERFNRPASRDSRERSYESNWKNSGSGYHVESSRRISDSELNREYDNRQYEKCQDSDDYNKEKDKDLRFYDDGREVERKSNDNFKPTHLIQEDPFDERENVYENKAENEKREPSKTEHRERPERPQRPDSRDSRASRDSRNSRDSIREDKLIEVSTGNEASLSWADSSYDVEQKEDKRRKEIKDDRETRRDPHIMSYHQRHIPGPITKEKLEASEQKCDSARNLNLVPLVRNDNKKIESKKSDNQWEGGGSSGDAWQRVSQSPAPQVQPSTESWVDMTSTSHPSSTAEQVSDVGQGEPSESQQPKMVSEDINKAMAKASPEREEVETNNRSEGQRDRQMGRGGGRGIRHDARGPRGWGSSYYRGAAWRGNDRGRRSQQRRPHMGRADWLHSESEASADEVSASTESGKEDKRQDQDRKQYPRSPKQGGKKTDKDDRLRDFNRKIENEKDNYGMMNDNRRYEKKGMYENQMDRGFPPRGEPSRRGRGGAPFRSKGSTSNVGRRMDGYGPPTSKKPFTSDCTMNVDEDKKAEGFQNQAINKEDAMSKLSHDEKVKKSQQQLAAGIIGSSRLGNVKSQTSNMPPRLRKKSEGDRRDHKSREISRRGARGSVKSGSGSGGEVGDENWETTSEASDHDEREHDHDDERQNDSSRRNYDHSGPGRGRRHSQANRSGGREKRSGGSYDRETRKSMVNGNVRVPNNKTSGVGRDQADNKAVDQMADKKQSRPENKEKRNNLDRIDLSNTASVVVIDDQPEVTVEEDQTVFAPDNNGFQEVRSKKNVKEANRQQKEEPQKGSKERIKPTKPQSPGPPALAAPANKGPYSDRPRTGKLPPRFAKLRENSRLQKMAQQQQTHDINELNKINQGGVPVFPVKDLTSPAPPPSVNAWDKPITASLRTVTPPTAPTSGTPNPVMQESCSIEVNEHIQSAASSQRSSPSGDKAVGKFPREQAEKAVLDGTSPPVQTIIFENTNYKSTPVDVAMKSKYSNQMNKNQRPDKSRERKIEEENVALGFKSPGPDMKLQDTKADPIQMPISFNKNEDNADMKLDFRFDSDLTQLTDDKTSKSITAIQMTRSIQMAAQSSAAELQFKLASVKKVWENPPAVLEHGGEEHSGSTVSTAASFTPTFGNSVEDSGTYGKAVPGVDPGVVDDGSEGVYNTGQQLQNNPNTYNGSAVQNMIKPDPSTNVCKVKPQPQSVMHPHSGPLSPPTGAFNSSPAQPGQHINYQPPAQYSGISAIPSPPTVFTPQPELYPTFQINNPQVLSSQGRSQFSQFAPYLSQGLGQTSGFSQQSMYLHQTAPPPPPPSAGPPDIFQTQLSQYRIQPPAYGTSQQLSNNPNTVLISSSTNSLMSASVKPSPQPIGAIGSKAASYQTTSQPPPSQLYIYPDPQLLNQSPFLQNSQLVQRQASNVVPTLPPSSASYYSASTGGGAGAYYQPGNSNMQAAAQSHMQNTFGMQAFNTQSPTPAGMGSFGSQMAQQYCSTAPSYLKSAAEHQDVLSVFSSPATQINSPKSRGGGKPGSANGAPQQQSSPTQSHKFTTYQQNISPTTQLMIQQQQQQQQRGSVNVRVTPRYPAPIQRPVSFQPSVSPVRHLPPPSRARYKPTPPVTATPPPTAATTAATHYYNTQSNPTKLDNTDLEVKVEAASNECESNSAATATKTADIAAEDSTSAND